ncbi:hypothetical protein J4E91_002009 [Alternaria rosae]|uniref:uncharacterized protein n=1 Tax=Alternaria rosae TaxID=1187941 RepID=UPI001E8C9F7A|nr:uncharacterized protein BKA58DRAFT_130843 [Alternaria rosae]KAH6875887.1 hypothetical protein BKA58DRAFT_130843 [Alternaria rosae]KAI4954298.1 hypothetical protein J4E91_002009 [Alternaria rosae]
MDDTDMTDVAYDIDIDVGADIEPVAQPSQPQQVVQDTAEQERSVPAAYLEDIIVHEAWPESLNLQGVSDFDPNDPLYWAMEHCQSDPRVKQLRWVNDNSVNLEFYNKEDATVALGILTHSDVGDTSNLSLQEPRTAKPYSKKPNSLLVIRQSNAGDQKPRGAATKSNYYQRNPDVAGNHQREPRRNQKPQKDYLDYGDEDMGSRDRSRRGYSRDQSMGDSGADRRGPRRNGRDNRDDRDGREVRGRGSRGGRQPAAGRLRNEDVDSYRPGSRSPKEPRFGRLRGRSASPASDEEGDGRFGFAENETHAGRRRYRSRSRSRNDTRRRREPSMDRWTHDRANYDRGGPASGGRWQKDSSFLDTSPMGNHHRSNAIDATFGSSKSRGGDSLLSRMTKNGQPVLPQQKRSLADRITRDDDDPAESFGRLKGDDRDPYVTDFSEPSQPRRGLADRITRDDDINIRGQGRARSQEGINIRGSADRRGGGGGGGINIRGVASGA